MPLHRLHRPGHLYKDLTDEIALSHFKPRCSYLFHVSVVRRVIRHFMILQLNNLFELIAIAFPLADNDHFIKEEYIPEDNHTFLLNIGSDKMLLKVIIV